MNEKFCPMRKEEKTYRREYFEGPATGREETFLCCIQEKCSWWVEKKEVHFSGTALLSPGEINVPSHRAILNTGKP